MRKRWQFFHASDFQSLMYPCFTFCRILGIFPYKINNSFFEASKQHYIFSIIIICVFCVLQLIIFYQNFYDVFVKPINFEHIIIYLERICYNISTIFMAIVTLILSSPRMRLLQTIMDISSRFSPELYQKLSRLIHIKDIFGFFYAISIPFMYFLKRNIDILNMVSGLYAVLLLFQLNMLYINCVCILKTSFKEINNKLLHIQEFIVNNEPHVSTSFDYKQRNLFLIMNIKALEKQHLTISNTVQMLNIIFSLQLLATIFLHFFAITCELYYYIVQWHNGFIILGKNITFLYFTTTIYRSVEIVLLVWACETGKNEAQKVRTTIHDVLNSTRDEQIKNELQLFSLQILHRENIFSAKCVNMDTAFLTTILKTITTYMLILLQFLIISHSCDEKSTVNII